MTLLRRYTNEIILFFSIIAHLVDGFYPLQKSFKTHLVEKVNDYLKGNTDSIENDNFNRHKRKSINKLDLNDGWKKILESDGVKAYVLFKNNLDSQDTNRVNEKHDASYGKVLIKRIVPHNQEMVKGIEYDGKTNTYYKPLVRVHGLSHKPRLLKTKEHVPFDIKKGNFKILQRYRGPYHKKYKDRFSESLKKYRAKKIIKDIKYYIYTHDRKAVRKLKNAILDVFEKESLRVLKFIASGEPNSSDEAPPVMLWPDSTKGKPKYPFWNYWTYEKSIFQDGCKGKLVQYGNLCIEPPP